MANVCDCDVGVVRLRASDHRPGFGWVWLESIAGCQVVFRANLELFIVSFISLICFYTYYKCGRSLCI